MARTKKVNRTEEELKKMVLEIREENRRKLDEILAIPNYQEYLGRKYYGDDNWRTTLWANHPDREDAAKENYQRMRRRLAGEEVEVRKNWNQREVIQLDLDGNPIKKWDTAIEAAESFGRKKSAALQIVNTARGKAITAYGYKWLFTDDYEKENEC